MTDADTPQAPTTNRATGIVLWVLCALWASVIFWWSSRTGSQIPGRFSEVGHFSEYFIFAALLYSALRASGVRHAAAAAIVAASLYGITDEFHQHFVPMRTPDVADWGMDTLGATCGVIVASFVRRQTAKRAGSAKA